jgi:hypothetical protein
MKMKEPNFYNLYNITIEKNGVLLSYRFFEFVFSFSPQLIEIKNFESYLNFILGELTLKLNTFNKENFLELLGKIEKEMQKYENRE